VFKIGDFHLAECRSRTILTDVRRNASQYDLLLASRFDRFTELGIVPSIDFALAGDERRIRIPARSTSASVYHLQRLPVLHVEDRLRQRSVWSLLGRSRQYHWQVEQLPKTGMRDHGIVVQRGIEVPRQAIQAVLQVQHDEHGVILVEAQEWYG
jgi:hypothetical protein